MHAFEAHAPDDWRRIVEVNLIGLMQVTQAMLPHMRERGGGRIVNMGSLAGKDGLANLAAYSAASAGIIAFTKALGREVEVAPLIAWLCSDASRYNTGAVFDMSGGRARY